MRKIYWNHTITSSYLLHMFVVLMAAYLSPIFLPPKTDPGYWNATNIPIINAFTRWDSGWYWGIAEHGYHTFQTAAFFPLFPYLMRYVSKFLMVIGTEPKMAFMLSGIIISNIAFIGSLYFIFRIVQDKFSVAIAKRTLLLTALFSTSLFFTAVYTESLFLLTVTAAFFFGYRKQWLYAGICCALCLLTRNLGVFSVLSVMILYIKAERGTLGFNKKTLNHFFFICIIPLLALSLFLAKLYVKFHDPLAFLHAQSMWGRKFAFPWTAVFDTFMESKFDFLFIISFLIILAVSYRKLPIELWLFYFFAFIIPLLSVQPNGELLSVPRYTIVLFPAYIYLASVIKDRLVFNAFLTVNIICLFLFQMMYSGWYWVA